MIQEETTLDFLVKPKSYEHEQEVPVLFWDLPKIDEMDNQPPGHYIDVKN